MLKVAQSSGEFFRHVKVLTLLASLFSVATSESLAHAEESHPGLNAEVLHSEAVIALSHKQTREAMLILETLLKEFPNNIEALELKALTLRNEGQDERAIASYKKLIGLRKGPDAGPYHFELAVIYQRQKKDALAKAHFKASLQAEFNVTITRFFLGLIEFNQANYQASEYYLRRVTRDDAGGELKLMSHYYLGMIQLKTGYAIGATRDLSAARKIAGTMIDSKSAVEIGKASEQILAPFAKRQWFGNVSMLGQYDSNISQIPTSLASANEASGKSTGKMTLSAAVGGMSAPLETWQVVGNYRFNTNRNTSAATHTYEYATNSASVFLNYEPLNPTSGGFKLEGNFTFQNQVQDGGTATDPSARYKYGAYNVGAEFGPFIKYAPSRRIQTELDLYFKPQKFYVDKTLSGLTSFAKLSAKMDFFSQYLNPAASLSFEKYDAENDQYRTHTWAVGASNVFKVTGSDTVTAGVDFQITKYPLNSPERTDNNLTFRLNGLHSFAPSWAGLADLSYVSNVSTVPDSYTYNRMTFGAGVSYSM